MSFITMWGGERLPSAAFSGLPDPRIGGWQHVSLIQPGAMTSDTGGSHSPDGLGDARQLWQQGQVALAARLAHELRNLLMPVILRLDVLHASSDLPPSARADLQSIREGIERLRHLIEAFQRDPGPVETAEPPTVTEPRERSSDIAPGPRVPPPLEEGSRPFTVMCIDDNRLLVEALERRLSLEADFAGMYALEDPGDALEQVKRRRPAIVLLDMDLPGGVDALALLQALVREAPTSRIIVFTGYRGAELVARAMGLGARGFVSKDVRADQVIGSIRRVVAGETVIAIDE